MGLRGGCGFKGEGVGLKGGCAFKGRGWVQGEVWD